MIASTKEFSTSLSSSVNEPEMAVKRPFTLEIIMCLTLNSAAEWAGSSFQVVWVFVVLRGTAVVLMVFLLSGIGCVSTIFVATYIIPKKIIALRCGSSPAGSSAPGCAHAPGGPAGPGAPPGWADP